jgi:tRNA(Ile)-lysidine synthetase-like protein
VPDYAMVDHLLHHPDVPRTVPWSRKGGGVRVVKRCQRGLVSIAKQVAVRSPERFRKVLDVRHKGASVLGETELRWRPLRQFGDALPAHKAGREWFDADQVGNRVILRSWQPGDRYQPIGMRSAVKLQDLFTNAKVPRAERHQRLVATTASGAIFWVEGLRISEGFKITSRTTRRLCWDCRRVVKED